jgi:competence ComEA-like helix-hairpin-helix protein
MKAIKAMMITIILMVTFTSLQAQVEIIRPDHPGNSVRNFIPAESQYTIGTTKEYIEDRQNSPAGKWFWINTFDGQSYRVVGTWELPEEFNPNAPGYYAVTPSYELPEGVINPYGFEMFRWIIILNPDRSKPVNPYYDSVMQMTGSEQIVVNVPQGYSVSELKNSLRLLNVNVRNSYGWQSFRLDLSNATYPDLSQEGEYLLYGQWRQLFSYIPLYPGMAEDNPFIMLNVVPSGLLNINTATFDELLTINGVGEVLAQRIIDARPFTDANDLRRVQGIGLITSQRIAKQVVF